MVSGIVLALTGLSFLSGPVQSLIDWTGIPFILGAIAATMVGGAATIRGDLMGKVIGAALLIVGIAVAVMGIGMKFFPHLWFAHWIIVSGGTAILVMGIIMAVIGLIGVVKGTDRRRYIKLGRRRYIYY